jgi:hypothetical protein
MEGGTSLGVWLAYGAICAFLLLLFVVFARTMMLFATLWFSPVAHLASRLLRIRRRSGESRES